MFTNNKKEEVIKSKAKKTKELLEKKQEKMERAVESGVVEDHAISSTAAKKSKEHFEQMVEVVEENIDSLDKGLEHNIDAVKEKIDMAHESARDDYERFIAQFKEKGGTGDFNYHVVPSSQDQWAVIEEADAVEPRIFAHKADAISYAKRCAMEEKVSAIIHRGMGDLENRFDYN